MRLRHKHQWLALVSKLNGVTYTVLDCLQLHTLLSVLLTELVLAQLLFVWVTL